MSVFVILGSLFLVFATSTGILLVLIKNAPIIEDFDPPRLRPREREAVDRTDGPAPMSRPKPVRRIQHPAAGLFVPQHHASQATSTSGHANLPR